MSSMRASLPFSLILLLAFGLLAQVTDGSLTFEVASVKPHAPTAGPRVVMNGGPGTDDPGQITFVNVTLRNVVTEAYGLWPYQIEHPAWVGANRYDIVARVPSGATREQAKMMMRNLLAERFKLEIRRETREMPVYALVVDSGGLKMKASEPSQPEVVAGQAPDAAYPLGGKGGYPTAPPSPPNIREHPTNDQFAAEGHRQSLPKIATWLTGRMGRPVIDQTNLAGEYDLSLTWEPDPEPNSGLGGGLLVALREQAGLRLESRKMPIEVFVVVSALRAPIED